MFEELNNDRPWTDGEYNGDEFLQRIHNELTGYLEGIEGVQYVRILDLTECHSYYGAPRCRSGDARVELIFEFDEKDGSIYTIVFWHQMNGHDEIEYESHRLEQQLEIREKSRDLNLSSHSHSLHLPGRENKDNPKQGEEYQSREQAKFKKGDYDSAIEDCDEVIRLNSEFWHTYLLLGRAKADKGD